MHMDERCPSSRCEKVGLEVIVERYSSRAAKLCRRRRSRETLTWKRWNWKHITSERSLLCVYLLPSFAVSEDTRRAAAAWTRSCSIRFEGVASTLLGHSRSCVLNYQYFVEILFHQSVQQQRSCSWNARNKRLDCILYDWIRRILIHFTSNLSAVVFEKHALFMIYPSTVYYHLFHAAYMYMTYLWANFIPEIIDTQSVFIPSPCT